MAARSKQNDIKTDTTTNKQTMKNMKPYRYITFATIAVAMAACSSDDELGSAYLSDPDAVRVNATISSPAQTRVNTEGTGGEWTDGDQIYVENVSSNAISGKNKAVFKYNGTSKEWEIQGDDYMVWADGENTFQAYYPYGATYKNSLGETESVVASYSSFKLPTDQANGKLKNADWMTASATSSKTDDKTIDLTFEHQLAKVTFNITPGAQYDTGKFGIMNVSAYLPETITDNRVDLSLCVDGDLYSVDAGRVDYDAYIYTAVLPEGKYTEGQNLLMVWLSSDYGDKLYVKVPESGDIHDLLCTTGLEKGKAYTFNVTAGKNVMEITSVTVEDWTDGTLTGSEGTAEEL